MTARPHVAEALERWLPHALPKPKARADALGGPGFYRDAVEESLDQQTGNEQVPG